MRILCFGDSNTWGYEPGTGIRLPDRWTRVLKERLPEAEILEEGLNGRNAIHRDAFVPEKCGFDTFKTMLMSHKPLDLVIVMLGTNDLKSMYHANAYYLARGMEAYIETLQNPALWKDTPMPQMLVVSPILLGEGIDRDRTENFNEKSLYESHRLADFYREAAETHGVHFLDASQHAEPSCIDHIHMDSANHRRLGEAMADKVAEILAGREEN